MRRLRLQHGFSAPREKVFRAWIDAAYVRRWFPYAARVHWVHDPELDPQPGGHFDWNVASDDNQSETFHFRGVYREVQPSVKLAFSWNWESLPIAGVEGPGQTLVSIVFLDERGRTRAALTQAGFPNEAARAAHDRGWRRCFNGIEKLVSQS